MSYRGDIRLGDTIDLKFTTRQISGAPFTLGGTPAISAYLDNSVTQVTAGITLTVDFDAVTGLNHVRVVASGANGFAVAQNVDLVITTGTVNSVSVVGEVIGSFSIEARSALRPTTSGRTLDVSAGGEAGVDWANVGSPTTAVNLSGTNIKTDQKVDVETIKTQTVTCAAGVTVLASVGTAATSTAQTGDNFARLGAPVGASISADIAGVQSDTNDIQTRLPAALVGGRMDSDVEAINNDATAADNLAKTTRVIGRGTASGVPTTTSIPTSAFTPAGVAADQFKGRIITFDADTTTTALRGQSTDITASSAAATPTFTVTALTTAPASGDTFSVT